MECLICGNNFLLPVLKKKPIKIWLNIADNAGYSHSFECKLYQCKSCGHVQQIPSAKLERLLTKIYHSEHAQASTQLGVGNWGKRRADDILAQFSFKSNSSALEIGCANGYILMHLKKYGFKDLVGIDPCIKTNYYQNGIRYISGNVEPDMQLQKKFDLIISIAVLEHVKGINGILQFVRNHLKDRGVFFFEVPNCAKQLESGDPALFLHEHVHYFTKASLRFLLLKNGFSIKRIKESPDAIFVHACKNNNFSKTFPRQPTLYRDYSLRLNRVIRNISRISNHEKVAFHGACNSLNNVLGWGNIKKDFGLFDNDNTKIGKVYFGKIVNAPSPDLASKYDSIIVVPTAFFKEIKKQYKVMGFSSRLVSIT